MHKRAAMQLFFPTLSYMMKQSRYIKVTGVQIFKKKKHSSLLSRLKKFHLHACLSHSNVIFIL